MDGITESSAVESSRTRPTAPEFERIRQDSLTTFLWYLVARLQKDGVDVPYANDRAWQVLFLKLKSSPETMPPPFLNSLRFNSDGPYLRSHQLTEAIQGLQLGASVAALNPTFDYILFPPRSNFGRKWLDELSNRDPQYQAFVNSTVATAKDIFTTIATADLGVRNNYSTQRVAPKLY